MDRGPVWSVTTSGVTAALNRSANTSAAFASKPTDTGLPAWFAVNHRHASSSEVAFVDITRQTGQSMRVSSTSQANTEKPAIVPASVCAPPMPPSPPVRIQVAFGDAIKVLFATEQRSHRCLELCLSTNVDPRTRGHLAVHGQT